MIREQPRILVVDDEASNIELIADIFEADHEVLFATTGERALDITVKAMPDLILLDIMIPGIDGFEVCARLKSDPLTADIPVIFVTGMGDTEAETRGLALGAVDYITKPINPPVVRVRVTNHIELKQARDRLKQLAVTDGLTGLANRRRFDDILKLEHARHVRSSAELTLIMLDIDHFKLFNDTYGHLRGDDCLRAIARAIETTLFRSTDLAARYGGEEFSCILPETGPPREVKAVAERIRQAVIALDIPHPGSPTAERVTVSLGVVTARCLAAESPEQLVARADEQLYRAKSLGRNRTCMAPADPGAESGSGSGDTGAAPDRGLA